MQVNDEGLNDEIKRVRNEYNLRKERFASRDIYSPLNLSHLFTIHHRQRAISQTLKRIGYSNLSDLRILEIGCGGGDILHELMAYRMHANSLFGVELILDRLKIAKDRFPSLSLVVGDGQSLPYISQSFDCIVQSMVFSSVLNKQVRVNIANEMQRLLRPNGFIIWYDFWINPLNRQTEGITPTEIRSLFKDCDFIFQRVTLAPPIARRLVQHSWLLAEILESIKLLNTHYIAIIKPKLSVISS